MWQNRRKAGSPSCEQGEKPEGKGILGASDDSETAQNTGGLP